MVIVFNGKPEHQFTFFKLVKTKEKVILWGFFFALEFTWGLGLYPYTQMKTPSLGCENNFWEKVGKNQPPSQN